MNKWRNWSCNSQRFKDQDSGVISDWCTHFYLTLKVTSFVGYSSDVEMLWQKFCWKANFSKSTLLKRVCLIRFYYWREVSCCMNGAIKIWETPSTKWKYGKTLHFNYNLCFIICNQLQPDIVHISCLYLVITWGLFLTVKSNTAYSIRLLTVEAAAELTPLERYPSSDPPLSDWL